jgi:hypothetical protein
MPGPLRDSIGRCDSNSYNLYEVNKRPGTKPPSASITQPIHKDTLELTREQLQKEALNRLRHTSKYTIAQSGFMRIGKYLFVGVTFPPYLILYAIPKWVLVAALPSTFSFGLYMAQKSTHVILKKIERLVQKMQMMLQRLHNRARMLALPFARLSLDIQNALRQLGYHIAYWSRQAAKSFSHPFIILKAKGKHVLAFLMGGKKRLEQRLNAIFWRVKAKFNLFKARMPSLSQAYQLIRSRLDKWLKKPSYLKNWANKNPVWQKMCKSRTTALQVVEQLSLSYNKRYGTFKFFITRCKTYLLNKLRPTLKAFLKISEPVTGGIRFISQQGLFFKQWITDHKLRLRLSIQQQFTVDIDDASFKWVPAFLRQPLKKMMKLPLVIKIIDGICRAAIATLYYPLWLIDGLLGSIQFVLKYIFKGLHFALKYIQISTEFITTYVMAICAWCTRGLRWGIYQLLVFLVMLGIVALWGYRLTHEKTQHLFFKSHRNPV